MELADILHSNAAYRSFTEAEIPDEIVYQILDLARFAPSGGNRQSWHVIYLREQPIKDRIGELYRTSWREYAAHVRRGLVPFAPIDEENWTGPAVDLALARETEAPFPFADNFERTPVLLAITARLPELAVMDNGLGRQSIVGGASVYPFAYNILLAARSFGLGGVITTVLCREEQKVREVLHIPSPNALAAVVALGEPAKVLTKLKREGVDEFVTVDHFDGPPLSVPNA